MAANSKIEWCDASWNPTAGCSIVSPGCQNCYAMRAAYRLEMMGQEKYAGTTKIQGGRHVWNGTLNTDADSLDIPLKWKKPQRIFVNSMSDLFHENVPNEFIADVFATMYNAQWHTFQGLTKRPERMMSLLSNPRMPFAMATLLWNRLKRQFPHKAEYVTDGDMERDIRDMWPLPNVWLGTSVEDQNRVDERIPWLLKTPAAVKFLSCEPLLGPVDIAGWMGDYGELQGGPHIGRQTIDWVIAGGESGPKARPMHPDWARSLRDQCQAAGVPFFFKQWGEWLGALQDGAPGEGQEINCSDKPIRVGKKKAGRLLDGREWNEFPPEVAHA